MTKFATYGVSIHGLQPFQPSNRQWIIIPSWKSSPRSAAIRRTLIKLAVT